MPIENLNFQGINRAISDFSSAGACEELINLRPTTAGLVPVKPFSVKMEGVTYDKVYTHYVSNGVNYITVENSGGILSFNYKSEGGQTHYLTTVNASSCQHFSLSDIHFAAVGNIILISIADEADHFYRTLSFIWKESAYAIQEANDPNIELAVSGSTPELIESSVAASYGTSTSQSEIIAQLSNAISAIQEENPKYCFGPVIIALALKTKDGKTFWTNNWQIYDPTPRIIEADTGHHNFYKVRSDFPSSVFDAFFDQYTYGFCVRPPTGDQTIWMYGNKITLSITRKGAWDIDTSIIQSVEVYASKPMLYSDPTVLYGQTDNPPYTATLLPHIPYDMMNLEGQLLYLQKSYQLSELPYNVAVSFELEFGGSKQLTNTTLDVDSGMVTRYGDLLAYNARFHYFNSFSKTIFGVPGYTYTMAFALQTKIILVYNTSKKKEMIMVDDDAVIPPQNCTLIISSGITITEVILVGTVSSTSHPYGRYHMVPSTTYNYSINYDGPYETGNYTTIPADLQAVIDNGIVTEIEEEEPDAINVTEQYNPFVFNVKNSYLSPGKVLNLQPQLMAVADISIGNAPLDVFTNRGVYALLQGDGNVLYGAFQSLSNLVSTSNSIPTENGTFFIAAGGLWVVAGLHAVLVSDALSLGPHKYIRDNAAGYGALCNGEYNVQNYESQVSFEDFVKDASLSYNRFRDELIISNPYYEYSYILSLKYRQWFKMNIQLSQDVPGSTIAIKGFNGTAGFPGASSEAPINGTWLDDSHAHTIEIELTVNFNNGDADYYSVVHTIQQDEIHDPQLTAARLISEWNANSRCGSMFRAQYAGGSGNYVYIKLTLLKLIPDLANIEGIVIVQFDGGGDDSEDFEFPEPEWDVVDFSDETENVSQLVHLQSRPFSVGYQYIHVHRIVSMIRASLGLTDRLIVALYGSDNLQDWTLLTFSDRSNVKISQIRTPSAARSWRYYTITIGGTTPVDTDFGTVMFDYQPVVRRIG